jgi:hypothetical protein
MCWPRALVRFLPSAVRGYQAVRERRREILAGRGTAASVASPASPKSASAPHRSNCSGGRGSGAALALTGLVRAVGLSGIEGTLGLRGMVWIQMPVSYRAQGMARPPQHSPAFYTRPFLAPAMPGSRPAVPSMCCRSSTAIVCRRAAD